MAKVRDNLKVIINDREFPLAATLRVAYKIQGQHGHKSYMEVFKDMENMILEHQIGMLWAAFEVANPEEAKTITQIGFQNWCLDNMDLNDLMEKLSALSQTMLGRGDDEIEEVADEDNFPEQ